MKYFIYIFCLFFVLQTQAQKIITKTFRSRGVSTIVIDGNSVFKIVVEATKTKHIFIQSQTEGENNEHLVLLTKIKDNKLFVSSKYQPLFTADNDKLSAHKLISIEFKLVIPEHLNIFITSNIASVFMSGTYNHVTTELTNGSFNANHFLGNLLANTIHGDIYLETNLAQVKASSKHGLIKQEKLNQGIKEIKLNSINGNITVTKTE